MCKIGQRQRTAGRSRDKQMPKTSYADVVMDVEPSQRRIAATPEPDAPFQVLIMGDFSGRASRGVYFLDIHARSRVTTLQRFSA